MLPIRNARTPAVYHARVERGSVVTFTQLHESHIRPKAMPCMFRVRVADAFVINR
jgi:hypothetical protein